MAASEVFDATTSAFARPCTSSHKNMLSIWKREKNKRQDFHWIGTNMCERIPAEKQNHEKDAEIFHTWSAKISFSSNSVSWASSAIVHSVKWDSTSADAQSNTWNKINKQNQRQINEIAECSSINQSINQSTDQSFDPSVQQSINQTIKQSSNLKLHPINQWINHENQVQSCYFYEKCYS